MWDAIVGQVFNDPGSGAFTQKERDFLNSLGFDQAVNDEGASVWRDTQTGGRVKTPGQGTVEDLLRERYLTPSFQTDDTGRPIYGSTGMYAGGTRGNGNYGPAGGTVDIDGKQWSRIGQDLSKNPKALIQQIAAQYGPGAATYDPQYGYLISPELANDPRLGPALMADHGWLDSFLTKMPFTLGAAITGGALGGAFPGVDMAGASIPAGQTGILSQLGVSNPFSSALSSANGAPGAPGGYPQSWNMLAGDVPEGGMTLADVGSDLSNFSQYLPQELVQSYPGMSSAAGAAALPGVAQGPVAAGVLSGGLSLSQIASAALKGIPLSSLLSGAGSVGGALINRSAAQDAAGIQSASADKALALQAAMYDQNRADLAPWRQEGGVALGRIGELLGISGDPNSPNYGSMAKTFGTADLNADPIYGATKDFQLDEARRALTFGASARGETDSGVMLKDLLKYGSGILAGTGQDAFNRYQAGRTANYNALAGVSGTGQQTGVQLANLGQATAANQGSLLTQQGNVQAAGQVAGANAITGGVNQALKSYQDQQQASVFQQWMAQQQAQQAALLARFTPAE